MTIKDITYIYLQTLRFTENHNLTLSELFVLLMFNEYQSAKQSEIAEKLNMKLSTITGILDKLEARKIGRRKDITRRSKTFVLLTNGQQLLQELIIYLEQKD